MSSTNTYTERKYCVYITHYSGNALSTKTESTIPPSNYIGSTSVDKIHNGYKGSVSSKKYKIIWETELKNNPHLFSVEIISYHDTRPEATYKELQLQRIFNVVTNPLFVNMSYAKPKGYFGVSNSTQVTLMNLNRVINGTHPFQQQDFKFNHSNRLKELAEMGTHPFQQQELRERISKITSELQIIKIQNGTHVFQTEKHKQIISKTTTNRNKQLSEEGLHPAQIWSQKGINPFQSKEHKQKTSIRMQESNPSKLSHNKEKTSKRSKGLINEKCKRPLYLEVKTLCEERQIKKPKFLHMKSDEFLLTFKQSILA
jgi:hypothetical protein